MQWFTYIENESTYTVQPETGVTALEVYNDGPDTVYYGRYVQPVQLVATIANGSPVITVSSASAVLQQGMYVGGTGVPALSYITEVNGNRVTLSKNCTADSTDEALVANAILNSGTGQPIPANGRVTFTADRFSRFLDGGLTFYVYFEQEATLRFLKFKA